MKLRLILRFAVLGGIFPCHLYAQTISTGQLSALSVNNPWALLLLGLVFVACAYWLLRNNRYRHTLASALAVAVVSLTLWQSPELRAQLAASFTNPAGETLPIPVDQIPDGGNIAGFEVADFTNASGVSLAIRTIELPTFSQCFPGGLTGLLLPPGAPEPDSPTTCGVGRTLANGATCRVDVDTHCRSLADAAVATISIDPASLNLTVNGPTGILMVTNTSGTVAAQNIAASIPGGSSLVVTGNTCGAALAAGDSCTITFTPPNALEGPVTVPVAGDNTNTVNAEVSVLSGSTLTVVSPNTGTASGNTGFTLTGTGLAGATSVTFDGIPATSINVVNSTTVTGVTPAHAAGAVDVVITTPAGGATFVNGYTYVATAVGQPSAGGIIACLNGGLNNLIAATADNSAGIEWGGFGTAMGASAQSNTDGASNTAAIVAELTGNQAIPLNSYGAGLCSGYEVDSQGNTPCEVGNTCYNDWFLPAGNNMTAAGQLNCLDTNKVAIGGFAVGYWSSTEHLSGESAWMELGAVLKGTTLRVRCVRAFTP